MNQAREILIDRIIQLASSNNAIQTAVHPGHAAGSPAWSANENQSQSQPEPASKHCSIYY